MSEALDGVWTEKDLLAALGISKLQLSRLRYEKGFPVVYLGRSRVYREDAVKEWLRNEEKGHANAAQSD